MVLLQGLCYVVDITMVFLTFIGIFDFVFHLVELYSLLVDIISIPFSLIILGTYWIKLSEQFSDRII